MTEGKPTMASASNEAKVRWTRIGSIGMLLGIFGLIATLSFGDAAAAGKTGAQFLRIGVGAKACAMGESFVALGDDPSAVYWNPATMTKVRATQVMVMHSTWFEDMSYQYVALVDSSGYGYMGGAVSYSSSGELPKYDEQLDRYGNYTAYDAAVTLAYANRIGRAVAWGLAMKGIQQKIEDESSRGIAFDLGFLAESLLVEGFSIGAAVQNIGPEIKFIEEDDPLPFNLKVGASYRRGPMVLVSDVNIPRDSDVRVGVGCELVPVSFLGLRVGYLTRPSLDNTFTAGFGLTQHQFWLDYGYVPCSELSDAHRIALGIRL